MKFIEKFNKSKFTQIIKSAWVVLETAAKIFLLLFVVSSCILSSNERWVEDLTSLEISLNMVCVWGNTAVILIVIMSKCTGRE